MTTDFWSGEADGRAAADRWWGFWLDGGKVPAIFVDEVAALVHGGASSYLMLPSPATDFDGDLDGDRFAEYATAFDAAVLERLAELLVVADWHAYVWAHLGEVVSVTFDRDGVLWDALGVVSASADGSYTIGDVVLRPGFEDTPIRWQVREPDLSPIPGDPSEHVRILGPMVERRPYDWAVDGEARDYAADEVDA